MPTLDGYEATRQLRGEGYHWPIIALTAYAIPENREECLRFGCDDHVSKPVDWDHLMAVLHAHRRPTDPVPAEAPHSVP
jgi:CheY-like chemotaxis protein